MIEKARAGKDVIAVDKGGDPFVFGRGSAEERHQALSDVPENHSKTCQVIRVRPPLCPHLQAFLLTQP
jgi:hypothetical protein